MLASPLSGAYVWGEIFANGPQLPLTLPETRGRALRNPNSPQGSYVAPLAFLLVRNGALAGTRLTVRQSIVAIGSGKHADLPVVDSSIAVLHARLELRQGVWSLTALGTGNRVEVDGEPVRGETPLPPGSTIRLGEVAFLFEPRDRTGGSADRRTDGPTEPRTEGPRTRSGAGFVLAVLGGLALVLGGIALELAR